MDNLSTFINFENSQFFGQLSGILHRRDGSVSSVTGMETKQFAVVHLVDVIGRENQNVIGLRLTEKVDVLVNSVRSSVVTA
jgi:hypothetical protein